MTTYCIVPDRRGKRYVAVVTETETEHSDGVMEMDDPDIPAWLADPALPFGAYSETGEPL